ncbi:hypothetical protein ANO11243_066960 [Dothideomycetidae sp. 11243]|nr:hypothetical protein ANO11243_066960 [fungal sp. No.11243]
MRYLAPSVGSLAVISAVIVAVATHANFSPSSRTIVPIGVFATTGNATRDAGQQKFRLVGPNATITFDFGQMTAGIATIDFISYSCGNCSVPELPLFSCGSDCAAVGLGFTESAAYIGAESDLTAYLTHPDGALYVPMGSTPYTLPSYYQRGSFRYLTLSLSAEASADLTVDMRLPSIYFTAAPDRPDDELGLYTGNFSCSDPALELIWNAGVYTTQLCTIAANASVDHGFIAKPIGWASNASAVGLTGEDVLLVDGAKRDRNPWSGDVSVSLRTALVSQNFNNLVGIRNVLRDLWTIVGFAEYVFASDDLSTAALYWSQMVRGIEATYPYVDNTTGLYNGTRTNDWGRIGQGGQNIALNAIYYHALQYMLRLASLLNETTSGHAADWDIRASKVKTSANAILFDSKTGLYWDNTTTAGHSIHPTDGNAFAVIFNLTNSSSQALGISTAVAGRLTKFGVTIPESPTVISPFISSLVLRAHFMANPSDSSAALDLIRTQWSYMLQTFGNSTTIEAYNTTGDLSYAFYDGGGPFISHAHGWSTGPTYSLLSSVVGLRTVPGADVTDGEGDWAFQPSVNGSNLTYAQGSFTTHYGDFAASWSLTGMQFQANLTTPGGSSGTVYVPADASSVGTLTFDGKSTTGLQVTGGYARIPGVAGGSHTVRITLLASQNNATTGATSSGSLRLRGDTGSLLALVLVALQVLSSLN